MTLLLIIGLVLTGTAVALLARAIALPRIRSAERIQRIASYGAPEAEEVAYGEEGLSGRFDRIAERVGGALIPSLGGDDPEEVRTLLVSAGMYGISPGRFLGYRVFGAAGAGIAWLWLAPLSGVSAALFFIVLPLMVGIGWMLPPVMVRTRADRRLAAIDYELPELIDSLVVTVEAGMGFTGALGLASREIGGPLGEELSLTIREQTMGLSTEAALTNMLKRADTPGMHSFVRSVLQGETLGVSIGEIMRALGTEMRGRRRSAAEERAHKAPVYMLFPLVFFIFPAVFIVLLFPAVYNFSHSFGG